MDIRKISGQAPAASSKRTEKSKGSTGFSESLSETNDTSSTSPASPTIQITGIAALMGGFNERGKRNKQQMMRANILLDELEKLRLGIVDERIPLDILKHLESALAGYPLDETDDIELKDLMLDIETRVVVELAKLEKV